MDNLLELSPLGKTWLLDLDGTIVVHNGYLIDGQDHFLSGAQTFLQSLPPEDMIIFITSRKRECASATETFLNENRIRYHAIVYDAPYGERILINDRKPSGLPTAVAINTQRDIFCQMSFRINEAL